MAETILAIDLGLTNCKVVLFHLDGSIAERESIPYPTYHRQPGWAEQEPRDWWWAVLDGMRAIVGRSPSILASVLAISVTAHMHALVCLGDGGAALGPSLVLGDRRSIGEADAISDRAGLERIYQITGARMDASMPQAKIAWLRGHAPEIYREARAFLSAKDWLRHQLTGDLRTDPVDACGTSLYDLRQGCWSVELVEQAGIRPEQLPLVSDPCALAGLLLPGPARSLGLKPGIPVVVGAGDDVEVLGNGLLEPGVSLEHLGTTGSILTCSDCLVYDPRMAIEIYPHVIPGLWVLGGSVTAAGLALNWAQSILKGGDPGDLSLPQEAFSWADDPLLFVPHLAGERCPDWDPRARGAWLGLDSSHTPADLYRAALEGIAFSLNSVLERIEQLAGPQRSIRVGNREALNPAWAALRATIYNRPLEVLKTGEPTALGAMMLAAVGIGAYASLPEAVQALGGSCGQIEPVAGQVGDYRRRYARYLEAAGALRGLARRWQAGEA